MTLGFAESVTVGSRIAGAEAEKAVPVDVITADQMNSSGYAETAQVIQSRGLLQLSAPDDHRRHRHRAAGNAARTGTRSGAGAHQRQAAPQSALVHLNGSIGRGSTGVDLNAIPISAIDHIEVLRDGAAA